MKRPSLVGCCLALASFGCHRASAGAPSSALSPSREVAPSGERVEIPAPQRNAPTLRIAEEEGVVRMVAGPLRYELRGRARSIADEVTPWPIAFARRASRGWLFVTTHAQVYASPTFTGHLTPLRAFGCEADDAAPHAPRHSAGAPRAEPVRTERPAFELPVAFESEGRAVLRAPDGALYSSDGATLDEVTIPEAVAAAWSGRRGAAIAGLRTLRYTGDDGATWRDLSLDDAAPLGVAGEGGALFVYTSAGWREVDANGALTTPTRRPRFVREQTFEIESANRLGPELQATYFRAPSPPDRCPAQRDPGAAWSPPRFVGVMPTRQGEITYPQGRIAPLGTPRGRAFADTSAVPAVVSVTRPDHPQPGHPVTLVWRGEDLRGAFVGRAQTAAPVEIPVTSKWTLVAAARTGLLFAIEALAPGQRAQAPVAVEDESSTAAPEATAARDLFWFSSTGVRRVALPRVVDGGSLRAVNTDDGGVVVLALTDADPSADAVEPPPEPPLATLVVALKLGPNGAEIARRTVTLPLATRQLVGVGHVGAAWGVVSADRAHPGNYALTPFEGPEQELGTWGLDGVPRPCGARAAGASTIDVVRGGDSDDESERDMLAVTIGPQGDGPDFAEGRVVTFERTGETTCLRRVWGVQRVQSYTDADHTGSEDVGDAWGAVRLNARGRGLAGAYDTGARIATASVTLAAAVPFAQDI